MTWRPSSAAVGPAAELTVVMEPTRSAWVVVAAHFRATGAKVVMIAPEQSADLRKYYKKHTKNDRLDSLVLSRVPLLHPEGLKEVSGLGPAEPLRRAVRRRVDLVEQRRACSQRIDAMLDLLGPAYHEALGSRGTKTSAVVLERYGNPKTLHRLGLSRLTDLVGKTSGGHLGAEYATGLLQAATEAMTLWKGGCLDFDELAWDLAQEVRLIGQLDIEVERLDDRIAELYQLADPKGIVRSAPGIGPVLSAGIAGRLGGRDPLRQPGGRSLVLGDRARCEPVGVHRDPTRHHQTGRSRPAAGSVPRRRAGLPPGSPAGRQVLPAHHRAPAPSLFGDLSPGHHPCHPGRRLHALGQLYLARDVDGTPVNSEEARAIIAERYSIPPAARRRSRIPDAVSEPAR